MTEKKLSKEEMLQKIGEKVEESKLLTSQFNRLKNKDSKVCHICGKSDEYSKLSGKCIFHCEKDDWYSINEKQEKIWDREKVDNFWEKLRNDSDLMEKMGFNYFVFPRFSEDTFWKKKEEKIFKKGAVFLWCTFLDDANFFEVKFNGNLIFFFCDINGNAIFNHAKFLKYADFAQNKFCQNLSFSESIFNNNGRFNKNEVLKDIRLSNTLFLKNFDFTENIITGIAELSLIRCSGEINFMATKFKKDVTFWLTKLNKASFEGVTFSKDHQVLFQDAELGHSVFSHIVFSQKIIFRRSHLEFVTFPDSKIDQAQFSECYFNNFLKRKAIFDEILIRSKQQKSIKEKDKNIIRFLEKVKSDKTFSKDYEEVEELNRQLKKNFEEKKDYETAGDFHIGEMEMRRKKFLAEVKEKNVGKNWFTRFFIGGWDFITVNFIIRFLLFWYWILSEYGEKPGRVFAWFLLIPIFATLYFWSFGFEYFGKSFEFALTSFIPLLPKNIEVDTLNWIQRSIFYFETIISAILWFLLLLSIQRKFRR